VLEWVSQAEAENTTALVFARVDTEGLVQKITILESELAEERRACETSEREHWECFNELTLLQAQGLELCLTIVGPPWAECLSEGMRLATLHHNEMVQELAAFWAVLSSATESVLRHSPNDVACAEVAGELVAELHKVEGHRKNSSNPLPRSVTFCSDHCPAGPS
jgi:hypothetical protein